MSTDDPAFVDAFLAADQREFFPVHARGYPPSKAEAEYLASILEVDYSPKFHFELHVAVSMFVMMVIQGAGLDDPLNAAVRRAIEDRKDQRPDMPEDEMLPHDRAARIAVDSALSYSVKPPDDRPVSVLAAASKMIRVLGDWLPSFRRRKGPAQINADLSLFLLTMKDIAADAQASLKLPRNSQLVTDDPEPHETPLSAFATAALDMACGRALEVLDHVPNLSQEQRRAARDELDRLLALKPRTIVAALRAVTDHVASYPAAAK